MAAGYKDFVKNNRTMRQRRFLAHRLDAALE
jgi:hypothetical protein